jgi:hypothetical protein
VAKRKASRRLEDFAPACTLRFLVGANVGPYSRKAGYPVTVDTKALLSKVESRITRKFQGATLVVGRGVWKKTSEPSVVVDVIRAPDRNNSCAAARRQAQAVAADLARDFDQEAVAVLARDAQGKTSVDYVKARRAKPAAKGRRAGRLRRAR